MLLLGWPTAFAQEDAFFRAITTLNRPAFDAALAAGADPNARDSYHQTPLMYSVRANQLSLSRELIGAGADVNARTLSGWTALHYAAHTAAGAGVIRLLLDAYADPTLRTTDGDTPADLASAQANDIYRETLATFVAETRVRLFEAIDALDAALFQAALRAGADVNASDEFGQSPLMYAVAANQLGMTRRLITEGARVNDASAASWTALHYAARANVGEGLSLVLLAAGADPMLRNSAGDTPSAVAAREGNAGAMAALAAAAPSGAATGARSAPAEWNADDCFLIASANGGRAVVIGGGEQGLRDYWSGAVTQMFGSPAQPSSPFHYYSVDDARNTVLIAEIPVPRRCAGGRAVVDLAQVTVCSAQFGDAVLTLSEARASARTLTIDLGLSGQASATVTVSMPWASDPGSSTLCAVQPGR